MNDNELLDIAANKLIDIISKTGLTQSELAERAELSQAQINHIINKRRFGTVASWFKIAEALGVPMDYFFRK